MASGSDAHWATGAGRIPPQLSSRRSLKASPRPGRSPASRLTETKKAPTCARPGGCQLDGLARCVVKSKRSTQTPATAARYVRNGTLVRDAGSGCDGGHGRPVVADLNGECRWWQRGQATAWIRRRPFAAGLLGARDDHNFAVGSRQALPTAPNQAPDVSRQGEFLSVINLRHERPEAPWRFIF